MEWLTGFIGTPGVNAVFLFALIENMGLPIPAFPVLMLAGALSRAGGVPAAWALCGAALGAVVADALWFLIGRWRGRRVLSAICRLSLNPEACVEAAEGRFDRRRVSTILLAKFVPGLNAVAPPLAGIAGMSLPAFLLIDGAGSLAWASIGVGSGWVLGAAAIRSFGAVRGYVGWLVFGGVVLFLVWNGISRYYLVRKYSIPRIPADELFRKIAQGEDVLVVDLRSEASFAAAAAMIPSAVRFKPSEVHLAAKSLPPDRELVFYCS
ncbi:MAG TPA: VTT domain-containing protein [bacterium]